MEDEERVANRPENNVVQAIFVTNVVLVSAGSTRPALNTGNTRAGPGPETAVVWLRKGGLVGRVGGKKARRDSTGTVTVHAGKTNVNISPQKSLPCSNSSGDQIIH